MRITNTTSYDITLTDIDRGNAGSNEPHTGIYESWNTKADNVVSSSGYIDVFDTDNVMLSTELGQIKTYKDAGSFTTEYSMTGTEVGTFAIAATATFKVDIAGGGFQSFTLPTGSAVTMADIVSTINSSATGFVAEESDRFFRSSNMDNTVQGEVVGPSASSDSGQRTPGIDSGFIVLVSDDILTIGDGNANSTLGFLEGMITKSK